MMTTTTTRAVLCCAPALCRRLTASGQCVSSSRPGGCRAIVAYSLPLPPFPTCPIGIPSLTRFDFLFLFSLFFASCFLSTFLICLHIPTTRVYYCYHHFIILCVCVLDGWMDGVPHDPRLYRKAFYPLKAKCHEAQSSVCRNRERAVNWRKRGLLAQLSMHTRSIECCCCFCCTCSSWRMALKRGKTRTRRRRMCANARPREREKERDKRINKQDSAKALHRVKSFLIDLVSTSIASFGRGYCGGSDGQHVDGMSH